MKQDPDHHRQERAECARDACHHSSFQRARFPSWRTHKVGPPLCLK
jgi:hypothetical protein